ncbi:MAG: SGNH/GDSL hydrolase family protein [Candidatus Gorgyraea atricola]|nr:SGNH/GDSL hydrolase family protein [Candidatus Gorgyraea atricola]
MRTIHRFKYIPLILLGIISTLLLLELVLFLSGQCLLWSRRKVQYSGVNSVQIACAGDSHTFGVGTSMQYSYPKQLEKLLNDNNPSQKFSVINLGIPGSSARLQFEGLKNFLDKNTAEFVMLLTGENSGPELETYNVANLRSIRFLKEIFSYMIEKNPLSPDIRKTTVKKEVYNDYMNHYLNKIRMLCLDKGSDLLLLSYYNRSYEIVEKFAERYDIPYFKFTENFKMIFESDDKTKYISPDISHMNHRGNKFFAEQLYGYLFLNQRYLDFAISPLLRKIHDGNFYRTNDEIKMAIEFGKAKIKENRDNPYDLIHLGHIYMEIGKYKSAKKFYLMGLVSSNYTDNNTIVSPIINWYLRKGRKQNALKICEEILLHNPENAIARYHYETFSPEMSDLK